MNQPLIFSETELTMLGKTADALSAYMGAAVLAEVGHSDNADWVIFGRALGDEDAPAEDTVHVQIGGPGAHILGQKGGLEVDVNTYDCAFLWAIQITDDPEERYVRLDQEGEIFEAAVQLSELLPFNLEEPEPPTEDDAREPNQNNERG